MTHEDWLDHVRSVVSNPSVSEFVDPLEKTRLFMGCSTSVAMTFCESTPLERIWINHARSVVWDASIEEYVDPCDDECRAVEILLAAEPHPEKDMPMVVVDIEIADDAGTLGRSVEVTVFYESTRETIRIIAIVDWSQNRTVAA